jgi:hypothetical protein
VTNPEPVPEAGTDLSGVPDRQVAAAIAHASGAVAWYQERRTLLLAELVRRHGATVAKAIADRGKEHGSASVVLPDLPGVKLVGEVKRTVAWDQGKLLGLAFSMPQDEARKVFKLEISVPEAAFNEASGNFRAALEDARTTKLGALTLKVEPATKGAAA